MNSQHDNWFDEEPVMISVRAVEYDPLEDTAQTGVIQRAAGAARRRLALAIVSLVTAVCLFGFGAYAVWFALPEQTVYVITENEVAAPSSGLAPLFTDEVRFWEVDILRWAEEYELDPNLVATVMQIESCGDPTAGSSAGAQGLFQVMPFHFDDGEVMTDPETNAYRGMNYLSTGLELADGDVVLAMAGYNGGHGVINTGWASWYQETRNYVYWGSGIYQDAVEGETQSTRLQEWLDAGGRNLCAQAAQTQQSLSNR